jgi:hypothetical protein
MRKEHKENLYHIALITQKEILDFEWLIFATDCTDYTEKLNAKIAKVCERTQRNLPKIILNKQVILQIMSIYYNYILEVS